MTSWLNFRAITSVWLLNELNDFLVKFQGYSLHVLGSTSEWVVGVMFILYFFTFIADFRRLSWKLGVVDSPTPAGGGDMPPTEESRLLSPTHV